MPIDSRVNSIAPRRSPGRTSTIAIPADRVESRLLVVSTFVLLAIVLLATPALHAERYGYVRVLEGDLSGSVTADGFDLAVHASVFPGDRLVTGSPGFLELVLADGDRVRLDSSTRVRLSAGETQTSDEIARLELEEGRIQFVVVGDPQIDAPPSVTVGSREIYFRSPGRFVISASSGELEVTVREGELEVLGHRGSTVVVAGESGHWSQDRMALGRISQALPPDGFEERGLLEETSRLAAVEAIPEVGIEAYEAADLASHGSWLQVSGQWAWSPRQTASWSPYTYGRWRPTPAGLTWVSSYSWGWYPYHYGSWDLVAGHGWVWYPGGTYSTAWVRWYVTPSYVGWVPHRYYDRHLRHHWQTGRRDWNHWKFHDHRSLYRPVPHRSPVASPWGRDGGSSGRLLTAGDSPYYRQAVSRTVQHRSTIGSPPQVVSRVSSRSTSVRSPAPRSSLVVRDDGRSVTTSPSPGSAASRRTGDPAITTSPRGTVRQRDSSGRSSALQAYPRARTSSRAAATPQAPRSTIALPRAPSRTSPYPGVDSRSSPGRMTSPGNSSPSQIYRSAVPTTPIRRSPAAGVSGTRVARPPTPAAPSELRQDGSIGAENLRRAS